MASQNDRVTVAQALAKAGELHGAGNLAAAEQVCRRILEAAPGSSDALNLLGAIALRRGDSAAAADWVAKAIALRPDIAAYHANRAKIFAAEGRRAEAMDACREAIALKPAAPEFHFQLGNLLLQERRTGEAVQCYREALALRPHYAEAHCNLGVALKQEGRLEDAIARYRHALTLNAKLSDAAFNLGTVLQSLKRFDEALACFEQAKALVPDDARVFGNLVNLKDQICDWRDWEQEHRRLSDFVQAGAPISPYHIATASGDPEEQLVCARRYAAQLGSPPPLWSGRSFGTGKIRLGYLSANFGEHATSYLLADLIETHDRARFEVLGFSLAPGAGTPMRQRMADAFDDFIPVHDRSNDEIARIIAEAGVGIALDLDGYTTTARPEASGRAGVLARRPAPVQVNFLGYPGTMGADFIDYIVADPVVAPADQQRYFAEKIVHLPDCYQPNDTKRAIAERTPSRAACGLPSDAFVFCCFNNSYKITPAVFDIWMRLLSATPESVLWLLHDNDPARRNLCNEARARGVDPDRLVFAPRLPLADHLARHRQADLFLDTLPCNAHTTASDALWAGLPLVTCSGHTFAGRVAASLLHAVGMPELVTESLADYETLALNLAREEATLGNLRLRLERNRLAAPLFDIGRYRRHIEAAYERMWDLFRRGEPPESFAVQPAPASHP